MDLLKSRTRVETVLSLSNVPVETSMRNLAAVRKVYLDQAAGYGGGIWDLLDPAIKFFEAASLPYGCAVEGIEATKSQVAIVFDSWSDLKIEIFDFACGGDIVVVYLRLTGVSRATGKIYDGPATEVFRFNNDKIVEWHPFYWDTHSAIAALTA